MRFRYTVIMLTLLVLRCCVPPAGAQQVWLADPWYAKISNYTGQYHDYYLGHDGTFSGFVSLPDISVGSSTPQITPTFTDYGQSALFDFHTGYVTCGTDYAYAYPVLFIGDEWYYHASFDWETYCYTTVANNLRLEFRGWGYTGDDLVLWSTTFARSFSPQSGHMSVDIPLVYNPRFQVSVVPVPEPSSASALAGLTFALVWRRRSRHSG